MTSWGYTLSSEEHGPTALLDHARTAEEVGFDFLSISDHYHPWIQKQGHSPFVWSVLGAVASATDGIALATGVTCPIMRTHPAVIAQAAATTSLLSRGRFTFGVGTGELLNEHITGQWWPSATDRREMLEEAIDIIRRLFEGGTVDHRGRWFTVDRARLFDPPEDPVSIVVSGFGPESAELAGRIGDGYWGTAPDPSLLEAFDAAGGSGPRYGQMTVCWARDETEARRTVHERWPNAGLPGQLGQDLPTWTQFEEAAGIVDEETAVGEMPCGPDPAPFLESVRTYLEAGYDHLYFHQVGDDQAGFFDFWRDELRPALADL